MQLMIYVCFGEAMRKMESNYVSETSQFHHIVDLVPHMNITGLYTIIQWKYNVIDALHLDRDIVEYSMNYLSRHINKRYASEQEVFSIQEFRLASLTCLLIAIKIHGSIKINANIISKLVSNCSVNEICDYEVLILKTLKFKLYQPTICSYLHQLFCVWNITNDNVINFALYLAQLSVFDPSLMHQNCNKLSLAVVIIFVSMEKCSLSCMNADGLLQFNEFEKDLVPSYHELDVDMAEVNNSLNIVCELSAANNICFRL